jgi:Recombination endonuclease VII
MDCQTDVHKCPSCGQVKVFSEFSKRSQNKNGIGTYCRDCISIKNKTVWKYLRAKHERRRTESMAGSARHDVYLKYQYGAQVGTYAKLFDAQNGKCAICASPSPGGPPDHPHRKFHLDHNHSTGKIRGLLCAKCNVGIGYFRESSSSLAAAAEYLARYENGQLSI